MCVHVHAHEPLISLSTRADSDRNRDRNHRTETSSDAVVARFKPGPSIWYSNVLLSKRATLPALFCGGGDDDDGFILHLFHLFLP